jgi:formyl-CoA transferase
MAQNEADGGLPLAGVRILAVEQMQALPYATQLLARLGADVVKVEHPVEGDSGRGSKPSLRDADGREVGATYLRNNLCKRSIGIDLKQPDGIALIKRLVPRFDVFGENFKTGTIARLGLSYEQLAPLHPGLIYLSVSGFGNLRPSPYHSWGAYAPIAEAMGGFYESRRAPGERPRLGAAGGLGDIGTSLFAAIGVLSALHQRQRTGRGQYVDVSMYDAMVAMADTVPFFWSMGMRTRGGRMAAGVVDAFQAKDGFFIVQCVRDHQLKALASAVGHPEWLSDPRLATRFGWGEQLESLIRPGIEGWAANKTMVEACMELNAKGVASGPCNGPEHLLSDPHVRDHQMLVEVARPDSDEPMLVVGNPIKLSACPETDAPQRWPRLGEHGDAILRAELGLRDPDLADLRKRGVIA